MRLTNMPDNAAAGMALLEDCIQDDLDALQSAQSSLGQHLRHQSLLTQT